MLQFLEQALVTQYIVGFSMSRKTPHRFTFLGVGIISCCRAVVWSIVLRPPKTTRFREQDVAGLTDVV